MAAICSECGETISKPYLVKGTIYGSTCVKKHLPKGLRKPRPIKGNWVAAELLFPIIPNKHQSVMFLYNDKKYRSFGAMTVGGDWAINGAIISRDQTQVMINLECWTKIQ